MGLEMDTGILINQQMQSSATNIYAIGECSQLAQELVINQHVALQQARLLASNLVQNTDNAFVAPVPMVQTEVLGIPVLSVGDIPSLVEQASEWQYQGDAVFRQVWLQRGKLVGAVGIGHWQESDSLMAAVQDKRQLWPWHKSRFNKSGCLQLDKVEQDHPVPLTA